MRIVVLAENTQYTEEFTAEHGLSLAICGGGKRLLFDFGQGELFARNAVKAGIDLNKIEAAILSHGHYDHGGGVSEFLKINSDAPVYMSRYAFGEYLNASGDYIGLDPRLRGNDRIVLLDGNYSIDPQTELCTIRSGNPDDSGLQEMTANGRIADRFLHEQYMIIKENGRKYVFSGCSHKGILNIVEALRPDVFVGGFHLFKKGTEKELSHIQDIGRRLMAYDTEYYTCHCTGEKQFDCLKEIMGDKLHYISCGQKTDI